jgi:hypothetical protein
MLLRYPTVADGVAPDVDSGVTISVAAGDTLYDTAKEKKNKREMLEDECLIVDDSDEEMPDDKLEMLDWVWTCK